jgi:hypothetical protein
LSDQWQVLYGDTAGTWLVLRGSYGRVPPGEIAGLSLLGETGDLIRDVLAVRMRSIGGSVGLASYVRRTFAAELGVGEAKLVEYADDRTVPSLSSTGWSKLAKAYCFISASADFGTVSQ